MTENDSVDDNWQTADDLLTDLFARAEAREDPYPLYARVRDLDPVHVTSTGRVYLTRYADCAAAIRNPALGAQNQAWMDVVSPDWRTHPSVVQNIESVLFQNPPEHTRLRKLVNKSFTARRVTAMRENVSGLVERALDRLADAASDGGVVDAYDMLARTLPTAVVGTLIGIPEKDWDMLHDPTSSVMQVVEVGVGPNRLVDADRGALQLNDYFTDLIEQRRRQPQQDILSDLVATADADPDNGMTDTELLRMVILLFGAGVDTTVGLLSNGLIAFLDHPEQARLLQEDPALAGRAVDEVLRYDSPTHVVVRVAAPGAEAGGVPVAPGHTVFSITGAAHHDPAQFQNPEVFDITRTGTTVLSFSGGIHFCVGAPLARMEAELFFPALLRRFPTLSLAGPPVRRGFVVRGYSSLPVTVK
ncbi:cytochrome P450 [Streptomyces sp. SL13]|jgi:cytochrome P450|uniref:Cytochrome P450 n=1 Tax=Streptantibioticus silvisoli TaxID=2705255 RepID=A0AA90KH69_9ACTN|nr:cytochrome P450 [Streptantibioticus silvisoli]MDI5966985.1 cytochrome P450 [Streptantibioticus silvisoli]MDI5971054.1 cytochrome P450 [Streptantibioticus silvisoli]